ncbi:MAG: Fe-S cluster assembly ATPase SufC [Candidatus Njordarchaeia archaeon]
MEILKAENLAVSVDEKMILKGINLSVELGKIEAILGPNGSGKTTLAMALIGHPRYRVVQGKIYLNGEDITDSPTFERARKGLFLGYQFPPEIQGVNIKELIYRMMNVDRRDIIPFITPVIEEKIVKAAGGAFNNVKLDMSFLNREVNVGFSGGERKKWEVARAFIQKPKVAIFDEPDSGVDVDALNKIADSIKYLARQGTGIIVISHYRRILKRIMPDSVNIMFDGKIIAKGGCELVRMVEEKGFDEVVRKYGN